MAFVNVNACFNAKLVESSIHRIHPSLQHMLCVLLIGSTVSGWAGMDEEEAQLLGGPPPPTAPPAAPGLIKPPSDM